MSNYKDIVGMDIETVGNLERLGFAADISTPDYLKRERALIFFSLPFVQGTREEINQMLDKDYAEEGHGYYIPAHCLHCQGDWYPEGDPEDFCTCEEDIDHVLAQTFQVYIRIQFYRGERCKRGSISVGLFASGRYIRSIAQFQEDSWAMCGQPILKLVRMADK
jgi:hypothetical protein